MTDENKDSLKLVNAPDWKQIVLDWQARNKTESTKDFCKARGIVECQFYYWKSRYLPKASKKERPIWSEVKIKKEEQLSMGKIKIFVADKISIELSEQTSVEVLSKLFSALDIK